MSETTVDKLYELLDESASIIENHLQITYLEALVKTGENIFQKTNLQDLDVVTGRRLKEIYEKITIEEIQPETIRKALQLAILKGMQSGVQSHHTMTPDSVALFVSYLVNKWSDKKQEYSLLDPAVGTGNLLTAVLNHTQKKVTSFGLDPDEILLKLAFINSNLQQHQLELYHQDSVRPIYLNPVDMVVSDLPVGYYPNEDVAELYKLKAKEGLSYVHHLLMEQSLNLTREAGVLIFLIPNFLFQSDEAENLNRYLKEEAIIQGIIQLPMSLFKNESHAKSILILQKKGGNAKPPKQVLMAKLPSFSNKESMSRMIQRIDLWFKEQNK
ncbi:class I SAM-dependent methyltransferase [Pseudalkalibacillus caeni]|uniref:Class I SAM-dependent methyltransferase n=1 Tax=Exobacillus caeni TaxID=2574798 RepID=A0A5R9F9C1_9BACL|nr:class I SAM-dependent methyltransferase [Pseudalkalibacillus caeni]TLS39109.1 class I SAM-dependent methyltransferase [Pseudalkalibacillus caeni]